MKNFSNNEDLLLLLKDGNIDTIFPLLEGRIKNSSLKKNLIALSIRHTQLKNQKIQGILDYTQETTELNRINTSLLEIISLSDEEYLKHSNEDFKNGNLLIRGVYKLNESKKNIVIVIAVLVVLFFIIFGTKLFNSVDNKKPRLDSQEVVANSTLKEAKENYPQKKNNRVIIDKAEGCDEELLLTWQNSIDRDVNFNELTIKQDTNVLIFIGHGEVSTEELNWKITAKRKVLTNISAYIRKKLSTNADKMKLFCSGEITSLQFMEENKKVKLTFNINF